MAKKMIWALIASRPEDIERLPLGGQIPALARKPWRRYDVEDEDGRVTHVFSPKGRSVPRDFGLSAERVEIDGEESLTVRGEELALRETHESADLIGVLPLRARAEMDLEREVLVGFERIDRLATAVHSALMLGCGAMQLASLKLGEATETLGRFLLRVESPSFFLVERWAETLPVYRSTAAEGIWARLGWAHPWEAWFDQPRFIQSAGQDERLTLIDPGGWWSIPQQAFRDVFETTDLVPTGRQDLTWTRDASAVERFSVPLRWGLRSNPRDAELWLVSRDDLERLEALLGLMSDADVGNLQLAFLQDEDGEERFVVREIIGGRSRQHLGFGEGYALYGGFANLFAPVDRLIEPPIRRDLYVRLFGLQPGTLTLVRPRDGGGDPTRVGMEVVRFAEQSFQPLTGLVDYLVRGARTRLENVLERSVLDVGGLARLPARPVLQALRTPRPASPEEVEVLEESEVELEVAAPEKTPKRRRETRRKAAVEAAAEAEDATPEARAGEEEALEREAVVAFEDPEAWAKLASIKQALGRHEMAIACLEHALWLSADEAESQGLWEALDGVLEAAEVAGRGSMSLEIRRAVRALSREASTLDAGALSARLPEVVSGLRASAPQLSKKARWLLWTQVLRWTGDQIEAVHLRETLLGELSMRGVAEVDSFPFVRRHLRNRQGPDQVSPQLRGLLTQLGEEVGRLDTDALKLEVIGSLAMGLEVAGDSEAAGHTLKQWQRGLERLPRGDGALAYASFGAVAARLGSPDAERLFDQGLQRLAAMKSGYLKDCVLLEVLRQIQQATLLSAEERLLEAVMAQIAEQEPVRQCLQLRDCAELLVDLGGAAAVTERVEVLLGDAKVRADLYSLEHALQALIICQSGRPPERGLAEQILRSLLEAEGAFDPSEDWKESGVRALDHAISALGADVFERIEQTAKNLDMASNLMLRSCVVRGLADQGQSDRGLAMLRELLEASWQLDDPARLTRVLGRLVPNISHFGRASEGLTLIRETLERLDSRRGGPLSLRAKGQVLAACARTIGRLGEHNEAIEQLERMIESFEQMIGERLQGVSHLFEFLGQIVDEVLAIGELERGAALLNRAIQAISRRLSGQDSGDHPYFVHQARIKCAVAMLTLDQRERGLELLRTSIDDIAQVRMFDGRDRVDLLLEAMRALTLAQMEEDTRVEVLAQLINTGMGNEAPGSHNDAFRRDLLRGTVQEVIQRHAAYRLEVKKVRALEERLIRSRVVSSRDLR